VPFDEDAALSLLADSTRRAIFALIAQGPSSVAELAAQLPISRPAVSQHLMLLKSCGLVRSRAEGTKRIYEIDPARAQALVDHLHRAAFPWPPTRQRRQPQLDGAEVDSGGMPPLLASIVVDAGQDRSFTMFTAGIGSWWPLAFHLGPTEPTSFHIEPWAGGRWYERAADGLEHGWGRLATWDPPRLLIATWEIDGSWDPDPDSAHASEVVVRFHSIGPRRTVMDVEHRGFDRLVGGAEVRRGLAAGRTWDVLLSRLARCAAADASSGRRTSFHHSST
jgi:DNA-binding transcriptional ArsR family regulator